MTKSILRTALLLFITLIVLGAGALLWLWNDMRHELEQPMQVTDKGIIFTVQPGMNISRITDHLHRDGILQKPHYLVWETRRLGKGSQIKAGEYQIKPSTTPLAFLEMLVEGRVVQYSLTFIEGSTFREMMLTIDQHPKLVHTLRGLDDQMVMERIGQPNTHPEGMFFPDTYTFPAGTTDQTILRRAFEDMAKTLVKTWTGRAQDLPYTSPYHALIMASIVEKETAVSSERPRIAGVFVRRLRRGMLLQTDPSVIYALGQNYDGNIRRVDLQIDSLYNTYRYPGLTPTPIAMPGAASIHAALHPEDGDALYFVAKGDGSHEFSATLGQHNQAVARYQMRQRSNVQ
jgi:UPF0755 protein